MDLCNNIIAFRTQLRCGNEECEKIIGRYENVSGTDIYRLSNIRSCVLTPKPNSSSTSKIDYIVTEIPQFTDDFPFSEISRSIRKISHNLAKENHVQFFSTEYDIRRITFIDSENITVRDELIRDHYCAKKQSKTMLIDLTGDDENNPKPSTSGIISVTNSNIEMDYDSDDSTVDFQHSPSSQSISSIPLNNYESNLTPELLSRERGEHLPENTDFEEEALPVVEQQVDIEQQSIHENLPIAEPIREEVNEVAIPDFEAMEINEEAILDFEAMENLTNSLDDLLNIPAPDTSITFSDFLDYLDN